MISDDYSIELEPAKNPQERPRRRRIKAPVAQDDQEPAAAQEAAANNNNTNDNGDNVPDDEETAQVNAIVAFFKNRQTHIVAGVIMVLLAVYLLLSAVSYVRLAAAEQAAVAHAPFGEMVENSQTVTNVGGPVGARLSHWLINEGYGIGAMTIVVFLAVVGLSIIGVKKNLKLWRFTFKCLLATIGLSIIAGFIQLLMDSQSPILYGGYHGRYINLWLISRIEWLGTAAVAAVVALIMLFVFMPQLSWVANRAAELYKRFFPRRIKDADGMEDDGDDKDEDDDEMSADDDDDKSATGDVQGDAQTAADDNNIDFSQLEQVTDTETSHDGSEALSVPSHRTTFTPDDKLPFEEEDNEDATDHDDIEDVEDGDVTHRNTDKVNQDSNNGDNSGEEFTVDVNKIEQATHEAQDIYDPTAELSRYEPPSLDLLMQRVNKASNVDKDEQEENKERITKTLRDYGIEISRIKATVGPTVTLYEIIPAEGVRIAKIKRLEDDIAMSLAALGIRIIAPIPGKGTIGIEVPNKDPQTVSIRSILGSKAFQESKCQLPMAMGATIANEVYIADLAKMPHLLVAGATGQGKSVGLNTIIASLLYKKHPAELKFVLVDPKQVEFSLYSKLQYHFMAQLEGEEDAVITDPEKVERTLASLCVEMDNRYALLKDANVRSLTEYNDKFTQHRLNPEKGHRFLPYIVIIVDEFADLIMMSGKAIETPIARIAQKARAVGMHMIIATQRPSTNVITGIIKANFPGRVAFRVSQMVDSKTILDRTGANQLIGRGDMLFSHNGSMERVQCAFIDTPEVEAIVETIATQPGYDSPYRLPEPATAELGSSIEAAGDRDPLFYDAGVFLCSSGDTASTSSLQRRFSIGYNRAGKIMDQLETAGVVSAAQGSKPRAVLMDHLQFEARFGA